MSAGNQIDYDALAAQHGGTAAVDYDALAAQHGGTPANFNANAEAPKPTELPGASQQLKKFAVGIPVGAIKSLAQVQANSPVGTLAAGMPSAPAGQVPGVQERLQLHGAGEHIGAGLEQTGEMALTGGPLRQGAETLLTKLPFLGKFMGPGARVAAEAANTASNAAIHGQDPNAAALAGAGGGILAEVVPTSVNFLRGRLSGKMAEIPQGSQFTRQEILDAARQHGVNLDVADATGSPVANVVKKVNRFSLAGNPAYEQARSKNLESLKTWADNIEGTYASNSGGREAVGAQMQQSLGQDLAQRKAAAAQAFQDIDSRVGNAPVDATNTVEAQAKQIINQFKGYYDKHPELLPKQAWGILQDLASRPIVKPAQAATAGFGGQVAQPAVQAGAKVMSWSELHQLRSDLMDIYRNNPDLIKGMSGSWLQRMVGTIDGALTSSSKALSPQDLAAFRQANQEWESLKGTYDNPKSPLYHAIRAQFPSQVPDMLSRSPELAKQVRTTLGTLEGPFQRQFVENILNNKSGMLDLQNLNSRLSRMPQDVLESMIGPDGAKELRMLGNVSQRVMADTNPSGTAKHLTGVSEAAALITHPTVAVPELAANYGTAKLMNSQDFLNYLIHRGSKQGTMPLNRLMLLGGRFGAATSSQE